MSGVGSRLATKTCFALIVLGICTGSQRSTRSGLHHISGTASGAAATQSIITDPGGGHGFTGLADSEYSVTPSDTGFIFSPVLRSTSRNGSDVTSQGFFAYAMKIFLGVTTSTLRGLWGSAADDVWSVGAGGGFLLLYGWCDTIRI